MSNDIINKTVTIITTHPGNNVTKENYNGSETCGPGENSFQLVILTLTLPLWSFFTLYLLLSLIHCLRRIQHFNLYDRCTVKNAYFRYDFHVVVGKYSTNFNTFESNLIVDLLDNQLISTMTIQVPGNTIFNENQVFAYKHSRPNLRCINFTIYRKHPIKDVKCIRVAHSCSNPDSRIFVYGINLNDSANGENKFFPITSIVKNRGTQWALNTTFDSRPDVNFTKIGCDCYDPFGTSVWPTYIETLVIIFYLWCAVLCFGHLIPVNAIWSKTALHALTVTFIAGSSAVVIAFAYLRFVKIYAVDQHSESFVWLMIKSFVIFIVIALSLSFWALANGQTKACKKPSMDWMISSVSSGLILTIITILVFYIMRRRKLSMDDATLDESDAILLRTNSRPNIEFTRENSAPLVATKSLGAQQQQLQQQQQQQHANNQVLANNKKVHPKPVKTAGSSGSNALKANQSSGKKGTHNKKKTGSKQKERENKNNNAGENEETLDNAFANSEGAYMKPRNRNSISQYV